MRYCWVSLTPLAASRSARVAIATADHRARKLWVFTADMQKTTSLKLQPGVLITDGLWGIVRNPNYFGELLVYLGFVLLPLHWAPPLILLLVAATQWLPRMRRKDRSLSRYEEFAAYERRTKLFIPYVW